MFSLTIDLTWARREWWNGWMWPVGHNNIKTPMFLEPTIKFDEWGKYIFVSNRWLLHLCHSSPIQEYQGSSVLGQFVTRFLLRETSTQLQSLQSSLDCAMEAVHDQGCTGRTIVTKPENLPIQRVSKRPGRRSQKNMCLSPTDPYSGMLTTGMHCNSSQSIVGNLAVAVWMMHVFVSSKTNCTVTVNLLCFRGYRGARQPLGLPDQPAGGAHWQTGLWG